MTTAIKKKPLSYYYWPVGIICFFLVIAAFNSFLAYQAFTKRPQATETSPYEAGQKYDEVLTKLALAKNMNLSSEFELNKTNDSKLSVNYKLPNSLDIKKIESAELDIIRPNNSILNSEITLNKDIEKHALIGSANSSQSGLWILELEIKTNEGTALVRSKHFL